MTSPKGKKGATKKAPRDSDSAPQVKYTDAEVKEAAKLIVYSNYQRGEKRHNGVIETAAHICHVSPKTMYQWLDREWFQDELFKQRQQLYRIGLNAVTNLQKSGRNGSDTANIYLAKNAFPFQFDENIRKQQEKQAADIEMLKQKLAKAEDQLARLPVPEYVEAGREPSAQPAQAFPVMQ